jgi:hypothetical protein
LHIDIVSGKPMKRSSLAWVSTQLKLPRHAVVDQPLAFSTHSLFSTLLLYVDALSCSVCECFVNNAHNFWPNVLLYSHWLCRSCDLVTFVSVAGLHIS